METEAEARTADPGRRQSGKVASKVIDRDEDEDEETVREAPEGVYQFLHGQQRLNALYTMLTAADGQHRSTAASSST